MQEIVVCLLQISGGEGKNPSAAQIFGMVEKAIIFIQVLSIAKLKRNEKKILSKMGQKRKAAL
ncbi:hypothetical protein ACOJQI_12870 [Bacillus salacetis]|uniref:hypothetical protein n=1 Tax=Bacillus salacetis TaxID=2315464 RepID=UPI003BA34F47